MVRAKFKCTSVGGGQIQLTAVFGGSCESPENKAFFEATPYGEITLAVVNPPAAAVFVEGREYFVDFTEAA